MALSVFDDKSKQPQAAELKKVLGASAKLWNQLISHVTKQHPPITQIWNYSGAKYGWSLRLKHKDRIVVYMTPQVGVFQAGIVLGEKAILAARQIRLPSRVQVVIDNAPRYAEGRGIRVTVATSDDLQDIQIMVGMKMCL